jgi:hypothetical protein
LAAGFLAGVLLRALLFGLLVALTLRVPPVLLLFFPVAIAQMFLRAHYSIDISEWTNAQVQRTSESALHLIRVPESIGEFIAFGRASRDNHGS